MIAIFTLALFLPYSALLRTQLLGVIGLDVRVRALRELALVCLKFDICFISCHLPGLLNALTYYLVMFLYRNPQ
jgi:hypothetical protein